MSVSRTAPSLPDQAVEGRIKCVVWDLDGTVWDGTLLEDSAVSVRPEVVEHIRRLDEVGILHSIASRNDHEQAMQRLTDAGLADYFLYPEIGWNAKSWSITRIAESLNIGIDALAFVDDQPFELAEVHDSHPDVLCVHADDLDGVLQRPEFKPKFVTPESARRREMYRAGIARDEAERTFVGPSEEFLATLDMSLQIREAGPDDLQRAHELTVRTHQLNSTGRTYSYAELEQLRLSDDHLLLVASLDDRFGSYGTIGLALVEATLPAWRLRLLLMSCRVVSRGVGTVLLNEVMRKARDAGALLEADFVSTPRNRMMYITYAFAGFTEHSSDDGSVVLRSSLERIQDPPGYLRVVSV